MKPIARRGLGLLLILSCAAVWLLTSSLSQRQRHGRTCQGKGSLDVVVSDSLERRFVSRADVEKWLEDEYRAYAGLPLDSVDLSGIEKLVCAHSVVRDCEAWLTDDGILHVRLSQREPVIRFDDGKGGYYADASGFLFPTQPGGLVPVPLVNGALPMKVAKGFKGVPGDPKEQAWLQQMIGMVRYMKGTIWEQDIAHIRVERDGDLVLSPTQGRESILFGPPVRVEEKFKLLSAYYEAVVPSKDPGWYGSVDLRYRGQLVCRK